MIILCFWCIDLFQCAAERSTDCFLSMFPYNVSSQCFTEKGVLTMCGEWWSWEVITIIIGTLGPTQLAADVIYSVLLPLYDKIPHGFGLAGASRVGTLIGENRYRMAKRVGDAILWFTLVISILLAILSYVLKEYIPRLFTSDQEVIDIAVQLSPLFCLFVIPHMMQISFQGILRGIKRQGKAAVAVLIGTWLISISLACLLAFHPKIDWGIFGMWTGNNVGYYVMDIMFLYLWCSFDWSRDRGKDGQMDTIGRGNNSDSNNEEELLTDPQEYSDDRTSIDALCI